MRGRPAPGLPGVHGHFWSSQPQESGLLSPMSRGTCLGPLGSWWQGRTGLWGTGAYTALKARLAGVLGVCCPAHSPEAGRAPSRDQQPCSAGVRPGMPVANSCLFPWTRRCRGPVFCQALCPETPSSRKAGGDHGLLSPDVLEQHTHSQQLRQEERMACPQPQAGGRGQMPPQGSLHPKRPPPSQA